MELATDTQLSSSNATNVSSTIGRVSNSESTLSIISVLAIRAIVHRLLSEAPRSIAPEQPPPGKDTCPNCAIHGSTQTFDHDKQLSLKDAAGQHGTASCSITLSTLILRPSTSYVAIRPPTNLLSWTLLNDTSELYNHRAPCSPPSPHTSPPHANPSHKSSTSSSSCPRPLCSGNRSPSSPTRPLLSSSSSLAQWNQPSNEVIYCSCGIEIRKRRWVKLWCIM